MSPSDRRINLNTSLAGALPDARQNLDQGGARNSASSSDEQAFRQALRGAEADPAGDKPALPASPFAAGAGLFGNFQPRAADADFGRAPAAPPALGEALAAGVKRLLVGDGSSGRREVRLDLSAQVLPGVSLAIYHEAGALQVEFTCASENARELLCGCAQSLADELSQNLAQAVQLSVSTDDPQDPCTVRVAAGDGW